MLDASGLVLTNRETGSLEAKQAGKNEHDRAAVLNFLKEHKPAPRRADTVLNDGLSTASATGRIVFLHFGAPWCGWCRSLDAWMARPQIAAILDRVFVDVKIDVDRDTGGTDLQEKYISEETCIPWFAFLDAQGNVIITSEGPAGNTGFPSAKDEIDHFETMLKKCRLADQDIHTLINSLRDPPPGES